VFLQKMRINLRSGFGTETTYTFNSFTALAPLFHVYNTWYSVC